MWVDIHLGSYPIFLLFGKQGTVTKLFLLWVFHEPNQQFTEQANSEDQEIMRQ